MVISARRPKPLLKLTNRIGVSRWTESSATRRGGLPREPRVLLLPLFPDLRRFDLNRAETLRTIYMGRRLIAINDDDAPAFARRYSIETRSLSTLTRRYRSNFTLITRTARCLRQLP
jgi:hypothetical protein